MAELGRIARRAPAACRKRSFFVVAAALVAWGVVAWASATPAWAWDPGQQGRVGRAVEGHDVVRLLAPAGVEVSDYENAGYRLRREGEEIRIEVSAAPLGAAAEWTAPADWRSEGEAAVDPIRRVVRPLVAGVGTEYEAASRILGWVARNIQYELDRSASQEALDVLERRSAYCTGLSRLTVALLQSAGLEAREVAGWVVSDDARWTPQGGESPHGFHRWVEILFSDVGWTFSDPLHTHHFVPAVYLRLASETVIPEAGLEGVLLERREDLVAVDLFPSAPPGVKARRNDLRQVAASLRVELGRTSPGLAVLEGESVRLTHTLIDGGTTFLGLEPGSYELEIQVPGQPVRRHKIELQDRRRGVVHLAAPRSLNASLDRPARPSRGGPVTATSETATSETATSETATSGRPTPDTSHPASMNQASMNQASMNQEREER